jgi:hypothetical protein
MADFGHGARHVEVRGDDNHRLEAAGLDPAPGLDGVTDGVGGVVAEIDAAVEPLPMGRHQPRDFAEMCGWVDPGDEKAAAAPRRQQFDRIVDAKRRPREHHNAVGIVRRKQLVFRHHMHEPEEPPAGQHHRKT